MGGVIRDHYGNLIMAYNCNCGENRNNYGEAMGLFWRFKFITLCGIQNIIVEGDSKLIIEALKGINNVG